jgi:hypothetical protein
MELWKPISENFTNFFTGIDSKKSLKIYKIFEKEKRDLKKDGEY